MSRDRKKTSGMKNWNFLTGNRNRPLVLSENPSSEGRAVQTFLTLFYLNSSYLQADAITFIFPGGATALFFLKSLPMVSYVQHFAFLRNVDQKWNMKELYLLYGSPVHDGNRARGSKIILIIWLIGLWWKWSILTEAWAVHILQSGPLKWTADVTLFCFGLICFKNCFALSKKFSLLKKLNRKK